MATELSSETRILGCLLCALILAGSLASAHADGLEGYEDAKPSGLMIMSGVRKMPPLDQRGIDKVALLLDTRSTTDFVHIGLTLFQDKRFASDEAELITDAVVAGHFQKFFVDYSAIAFVDLTASKQDMLPFIKFSAWDGKARFVDDPATIARLNEMAAQGIDAILLVQEKDAQDFVGGSTDLIGAKGLYRRGKQVRVSGEFSVRMIDISTRKEMKNTYFAQGATRLTDTLPLRNDYAEYSADERKQLSAELDGIYAFNAEQALRTLKVDRIGNPHQ